jgi:drug/metabolite transporter (DMT)-like permease
MQPTSLVLLLVAAVLHAIANALMKRARDKLAFTWWMLGASSVLGAPLLLFAGWPHDAVGWLLVGVSGLLEAVYFVALSRAYSLGDLSQVYPIARGSAPIFIVAWAGLFLHERPSVAGMCGVLTIVVGLYLINLPSLGDWKRPLARYKDPAARWALLTGVLISAYATVDKLGVAHVEPGAYVVLILVVAWLVLAGQWLLAGRRRALLEEIGAGTGQNGNPARLCIVLGAVVGVAAYLLVLLALRLSPVGYIGAVREISVVIGAWMGVRLFGDRGGAVRIVASTLVVMGILLIAVAG